MNEPTKLYEGTVILARHKIFVCLFLVAIGLRSFIKTLECLQTYTRAGVILCLPSALWLAHMHNERILTAEAFVAKFANKFT
jgi:hypothetical protein